MIAPISPADVGAALRGIHKGNAMDHDAADRALLRMPRSSRLFALDVLAGDARPDDVNRLLARWWTDTEFPSTYGTGRIVRLFKVAGFVTDRDDVGPPTADLTVYRGHTGRSPHGVSWTLDAERAEWFARRFPFDSAGVVSVATVPPHHVLGIFHDRKEVEVVVNPRGLRALRVWREFVDGAA